MSLRSLIEQLGSDKTASELVALLNAESVEVRDDQLYTWAGVALAVGPTNAEYLRIALESNGIGWAVHQLGGSGIQLSLDLTQGMLNQFAQGGVPGCAELASIGVHFVSPFVANGGEGLVTTEQVQAALLEIQKESLIGAARDMFEQYRVIVAEWNGVGDPPVMGG